MNVALAFSQSSLHELFAQLAGGSLTVYSVARPVSPDLTVDRSSPLVTFTFANPAFSEEADGQHAPKFVEESVVAAHVGTPGFARACMADGSVVADFSAGPGRREIKFNDVSFSPGAPVRVTYFEILPEHGWPERRDYYNTHPRAGYPMPQTP